MPRNSLLTGLVGLALVFAPAITAQVLPPPPAALTMPATLVVREFQFTGNTAFSQTDLAKVTAPFANRPITTEELEDARRAVTLHYINHGYVNSGAVIPDQDPANGVVTLRIVEGALTRVDVRGNHWLRKSFLNDQLQCWSRSPLNMNDLKEGLSLLRQNPNITQINAELLPGTTPGESILDLRVVDEQPFRVALQVDNHRPPSVGAEEISLQVADLNLTGHSDPLTVVYGIATAGENDGWGMSGVDNVAGNYTLPVGPAGTTLGLRASRENSGIIEEPFTTLDINSETIVYGVELRQPIYRTANRELAVSVAFARRQSDSELSGQPYDISPGSVNGRMIVSVLGLSQEWTDRGANHVLALRSTFNIGLDVLDATDDDIAGNPDATFLSWIGQAQYVRRLFNTQNQLILRVNGQVTDDKLLALEQMSVGGANTVRGYRENQLVRDRAIVASLEFRVPVLFDKAGAGIIHLAPFFDFGGAWNIGDSVSPTTIYSTGIGVLITPNKHLDAQLYWGYALRDVDNPHDDPQDLGLHFRVNVAAF